MRPFAPVGRAPAVTLLLLLAGACSDQIVDSRPPAETGGIPGTPIALQKVACRGSLSSLTVRCGSPESGGSGDIIIGGQNVYVTLASSNVAYNGGTGQFTFDVTVKSLIEQPIGTTDGVTLDPGGVRVFFEDGPDVTSGTGSAAVVPDGFGTFTAAGQPYYQYGDVLEQNEVSTAKTWTIVMPPTVTTFNFLLYVAAPVQWPDGYITLNGALPGALYGSIHPGENEALVAVIKSPVGNPLPGAVTFGTTNPACATVDGTGTMTGVQAATCSITAESGALTGSMVCDVTGAVRQWDGSVSSDWSVGGNWVGDLVPVAEDSVDVPIGVPNFPALVNNTSIMGVEVADGATLSLGAFNLSAGANVATGPTAGSGVLSTGGLLLLTGNSGVVQGRFPSLLVTGTYSLSGNVTAAGVQQVDSGELDNPGFEFLSDA